MGDGLRFPEAVIRVQKLPAPPGIGLLRQTGHQPGEALR